MRSRRCATRTYLLSSLIECELCGSAYVGHTSTNSKGYQTAYYCCGNKYRTHTCTAKNINAVELETFVVQQVRAFLAAQDFSEAAQEIANQVNGASADLAAEKAELADIESQLANGLKAILRGFEMEELTEEMDRLKLRKSELVDIIARKSSSRPYMDPADIERMLKEDAWRIDQITDQAELAKLVRQYVTKIYAHANGSCTVNIGVHMTGCGDRI